jgi:NifU-like protein involved in Fe-S cluster formation
MPNNTRELYNREILRYAASIPHLGHLEKPGLNVVKTSRICGSRVSIDVNIRDGAVREFAQDVKACALGQAACSIVGDMAVGLTRSELAPVKQAMQEMLKAAGPPPTGRWQALKIFELAAEHKSRHSSIMLVFECLMEAFDQAEVQDQGSL